MTAIAPALDPSKHLVALPRGGAGKQDDRTAVEQFAPGSGGARLPLHVTEEGRASNPRATLTRALDGITNDDDRPKAVAPGLESRTPASLAGALDGANLDAAQSARGGEAESGRKSAPAPRSTLRARLHPERLRVVARRAGSRQRGGAGRHHPRRSDRRARAPAPRVAADLGDDQRGARSPAQRRLARPRPAQRGQGDPAIDGRARAQARLRVTRAATVCSVPNCPHAQPCPEHPPRRGSTRAWRRVREQVLQRDGFRCRECGAFAREVDHIVDVSLGGGDEPGNLRSLCARGHAARH
jgi:HNH endonuclease